MRHKNTVIDSTRKHSSWFIAAALLLFVAASALAAGNVLHQGSWTKKGFDIDGKWQIVDDGGKRFVVLSDDFRTKKAPDLKIFLSTKPLAQITGSNATQQATLVAKLKSHKGAQRYEIPASTNLGNFKTVIIHCEKYSKLWGGAAL